jgi:hypothetical protein
MKRRTRLERITSFRQFDGSRKIDERKLRDRQTPFDFHSHVIRRGANAHREPSTSKVITRQVFVRGLTPNSIGETNSSGDKPSIIDRYSVHFDQGAVGREKVESVAKVRTQKIGIEQS